MRRRQLVQLTAATLAAPSLSAFAQSFPARPIKLLVAFPAGGPTDVMTRVQHHYYDAGHMMYTREADMMTS